MMIKVAVAAELKQWLDQGQAVLVDVREADEYAEGHIAGAFHIPLASLSSAILPPFAGKKLVMQCRSGGRSLKACEKLINEIPHTDLYNLQGGIMAWAQAGLVVEAP